MFVEFYHLLQFFSKAFSNFQICSEGKTETSERVKSVIEQMLVLASMGISEP